MKAFWLAMGAVASAFSATLCCLPALLFLLFDASFGLLSQAGALAQYHPILSGAACAVFWVAAEAREVYIDVPDMHCPLCAATVKKVLLSVEGMESVKVKLSAKSADVVAKDNVKNEVLLKALAKTGYPGVIKK